jgi:hypothetical protein
MSVCLNGLEEDLIFCNSLHEVLIAQHVKTVYGESLKKKFQKFAPELKDAIELAFNEIRSDPTLLRKMSIKTWRKIQQCAENAGIHTHIL